MRSCRVRRVSAAGRSGDGKQLSPGPQVDRPQPGGVLRRYAAKVAGADPRTSPDLLAAYELDKARSTRRAEGPKVSSSVVAVHPAALHRNDCWNDLYARGSQHACCRDRSWLPRPKRCRTSSPDVRNAAVLTGGVRVGAAGPPWPALGAFRGHVKRNEMGPIYRDDVPSRRASPVGPSASRCYRRESGGQQLVLRTGAGRRRHGRRRSFRMNEGLYFTTAAELLEGARAGTAGT